MNKKYFLLLNIISNFSISSNSQKYCQNSQQFIYIKKITKKDLMISIIIFIITYIVFNIFLVALLSSLLYIIYRYW